MKNSKRVRPKVNVAKRLVMVYHKGLGMYEVAKVTKKGKLSKRYEPRVSFQPEYNLAMRAMGVPMAGFKSVLETKHVSRSWADYIERTFKQAINQNL